MLFGCVVVSLMVAVFLLLVEVVADHTRSENTDYHFDKIKIKKRSSKTNELRVNIVKV